MASARQPKPSTHCSSDYALSVEPRLVTLRHQGVTIARSSCAIRAERPGAAPVLFVPAEDVTSAALEISTSVVAAPGLGRARVVNVCTGDARLKAAAYRLEETTERGACLAGRIGFDATRFETDEPTRSNID